MERNPCGECLFEGGRWANLGKPFIQHTITETQSWEHWKKSVDITKTSLSTTLWWQTVQVPLKYQPLMRPMSHWCAQWAAGTRAPPIGHSLHNPSKTRERQKWPKHNNPVLHYDNYNSLDELYADVFSFCIVSPQIKRKIKSFWSFPVMYISGKQLKWYV